MKIKTETLTFTSTQQFQLIDITDQIKAAVRGAGVKDGAVHVFTPHTTASIKLNHTEPLLMQDMMRVLYRLVPVDHNYAHDTFEIRSGTAVHERSNGHAHVKAFLLGSSETVPISKGVLMIGPRQNFWLVELDGGRKRSVVVQIMGE